MTTIAVLALTTLAGVTIYDRWDHAGERSHRRDSDALLRASIDRFSRAVEALATAITDMREERRNGTVSQSADH